MSEGKENKIEIPKAFLVTGNVLVAVGNYIVKRPHGEVDALVIALKAASIPMEKCPHCNKALISEPAEAAAPPSAAAKKAKKAKKGDKKKLQNA